ncbi:MAG TPA: hypothetical protein VFX96_03525 [Pyrinomonadaceae bacterium]|nr:hypothetical protein [Pyrinomonadaceae bacterium]
MTSKIREMLKKALAPAFAALLMLPAFAVTTQAQTGWWGNQDRRERRQERRENRRERRQDRREDRRERREDRRDDGYYGGGYYGNDNLRQTALNAGYNNGIEEGRKDRSRGERYNFRDEGDYQKATEDYSSRLGDRSLYQRYFRQGFENGYRDGWNGY